MLDTPPIQVGPQLDETWDLTDEMFAEWWGLLDEDDRQEFTVIYHGDRSLARFVCAVDYLAIQRVQAPTEALYALAYFIAQRPFEPSLTLEDPLLPARAVRAWRHDAVQSLVDRVRYRAIGGAKTRITTRSATLLELALEEATHPDCPLRDKAVVLTAAAKFMVLMNDDEARIRSERTKRGLENARSALTRPEEELEPRAIEAYAKLLLGKMSPEKRRALTGD